MASAFSANQYEGAFKSNKLQNWTVPKLFKERPSPAKGHTTFIATDRGHLLSGVKRGSAWTSFQGTWDLPRRIPPVHINPTARSREGQERLKSWSKVHNLVMLATGEHLEADGKSRADSRASHYEVFYMGQLNTLGKKRLESQASQHTSRSFRPATQQRQAVSRPATQQIQGDSRPATQQIQGDSRPATQQIQGDSRPATQQSQADSRPATQQSQADSRPATQQSQADSRPATQQSQADSRPATQQSQADSRPATQQSQAD